MVNRSEHFDTRADSGFCQWCGVWQPLPSRVSVQAKEQTCADIKKLEALVINRIDQMENQINNLVRAVCDFPFGGSLAVPAQPCNVPEDGPQHFSMYGEDDKSGEENLEQFQQREQMDVTAYTLNACQRAVATAEYRDVRRKADFVGEKWYKLAVNYWQNRNHLMAMLQSVSVRLDQSIENMSRRWNGP